MTFPQAVTAQLYDIDGTTLVSGALDNAFGIEFLDELSGPGSGSVSLSLSEGGADELTPGRFVRVLIDGTARFTFMIEGDPQMDEVVENEEVDQIISVSGRGWGAVLDTGIVYPENLTLDLDTQWRLYSFASPNFPNAGAWTAAEELYEYLDGVAYGARWQYAYGALYPSPISFPFPTSPNVLDVDSDPPEYFIPTDETFWIWPAGEEESNGYAFFRNTFTVADDTVYTFAVTADNYFTLFLEGVPILGEWSEVLIWRGWKEISLFLTAGTYSIAAVCQNPVWPVAYNPGGFIMDVYIVDETQLPTTLILSTNNTWDAFFSADFWPGWTPGQIILDVISESVARGELNAYASAGFDADDDSALNNWADVQEGSAFIPAFGAEVGRTIMAALNKMKDEGHIEWHVRGGTFVLDAWAPSSLGTSSGVTFTVGSNIRSLQRGATDIYANALLVHWEHGYVEVEDTAAQTAFGSRVPDVYESQASSPDEATRLGQVELLRRAAGGWPAVVVEIEPTSSSDAPYTGFELGETVTIPAAFTGTESAQVLSISLTSDDEGNAQWRCELNRRWTNPYRKGTELLQEIGGRSGYLTGVVK